MSILVTVLLTLHLLVAIIWVGGLFFIWMVLRPVLDTMDEESCLTLWVAVLLRFFHWVWGHIMRKSAELRLTLTANIHKIYLQGEKQGKRRQEKSCFTGSFYLSRPLFLSFLSTGTLSHFVE